MKNRYIEIWKEIPRNTKNIIDIGGRKEELLNFSPIPFKGTYLNYDISQGNDITKTIKKINKYDVIIFSHVIEHLSNQKTALQNIRKMMSKDSKLILLTPNVFSWRRILLYFLRGNGRKRIESYGGSETHLVTFHLEVLKNLLESENFLIEKIKFLDTPINMGKFSEEILLVAKLK